MSDEHNLQVQGWYGVFGALSQREVGDNPLGGQPTPSEGSHEPPATPVQNATDVGSGLGRCFVTL